MSLARWIERHALFVPDKMALIGPDRALTYRQFSDRIDAMARVFSEDLSLNAGDRVAYLGLNSAELLVLLFACAKRGLILVPVNWRLAPDEVSHVLSDCSVSAVLVEAGMADTVEAIKIDADCQVLSVGPNEKDLPDISALADGRLADGSGSGESSDADIGDDQPLLIVYTSGTTGRPKGAVLSQRAVHYNALNSVHAHDMTAEDHVLSSLPMFHVGGLNIQTTPALYCGATVTVHDRFDPDRVLDAIERDLPTLTLLVPAMVQALLNHPRWKTTDVSSVRAIPVGSTDVPIDLIEALHARDLPVIQIYGSTETAPTAIYQRPHQARSHAGSIGMAGLHVDVRLVDEDGRDCADNQEGELLIRGPNVMSGYWEKPEATAATMVGDWFKTGDVAKRAPDGSYWFADRIKNVIISGGENVYPAELERVFRTIPGVAEVSVVGRADADWGEVPVAVIGATGPQPEPQSIRDAMAENLARYKHAKGVLFVDELPRNVMGKVDLEAVRSLVSNEADQIVDLRST